MKPPCAWRCWPPSQTFDEKDVPEQERCLVLRPAQYYLLNQTTKVLNRD